MLAILFPLGTCIERRLTSRSTVKVYIQAEKIQLEYK